MHSSIHLLYPELTSKSLVGWLLSGSRNLNVITVHGKALYAGNLESWVFSVGHAEGDTVVTEETEEEQIRICRNKLVDKF